MSTIKALEKMASGGRITGPMLREMADDLEGLLETVQALADALVELQEQADEYEATEDLSTMDREQADARDEIRDTAQEMAQTVLDGLDLGGLMAFPKDAR